MLLATIGDILTIRKHYQKTFTFNSDESVNDNSLTCFDVNKFKDKLEQLGDTHLTGNNLLNIFESCLIEVEMNEGDNFHMSIRDPNGSGNTNVGYSGKSNYDSYNHYEPSNMDDSRIIGSNTLFIPKNTPTNTPNIYNQERTTSTGRKAPVI